MFLEWWMFGVLALLLVGAQWTSYNLGIKDGTEQGMELTLSALVKNGTIRLDGEKIIGVSQNGS